MDPGTTQKVFSAILDGTDSLFYEKDLTLPKPRNVPGYSFASEDVVMVDRPAFGGRLPARPF